MKRFLMCLCAMMTALVLTSAASAAPKTPTVPKAPAPKASEVSVDGRKVGTIQLVQTGQTNVATLPSGHRVTLTMQNGNPLSASAVDGRGNALRTQMQRSNQFHGGVIIIVWFPDGTVIVVVVVWQR